jgi:hypothetical protein
MLTSGPPRRSTKWIFDTERRPDTPQTTNPFGAKL